MITEQKQKEVWHATSAIRPTWVFTLPFTSCVPWADDFNSLTFHRLFMRNEMMYINIEKRSRHRERVGKSPSHWKWRTAKMIGIPVVVKKTPRVKVSPETVLKVQYNGQGDSKKKPTEGKVGTTGNLNGPIG